MNTIITIGREYGSGGKEIAAILAKRFDIPCYDRELILLAAEKSGLSRDVLERVDETATNSFLYAISTGNYGMGGIYGSMDLPLNDKLFIAQSNVIREAAEAGPCVIVGRCADAVLAQWGNVVSVFIWAEMDYRMKNVMARENVTDKKAVEIIAKKDKKRASYYNFYTQKTWGVRQSYDLCINHTQLDAQACADIIADYVLAREARAAAQ